MGFNVGDAVLDHTRSPLISPRSSSNLTAVTSSPLHAQFGGLSHANMGSLEMGDSGMVVASPLTEASTDVEIHDRNRNLGNDQYEAIVSRDCSGISQDKTEDCKKVRGRTQNREAARKSRLRKKAGVG